MNYANVGKSLLLGLGIGVVLIVVTPGEGTALLRVASVLASGGIGLVVGLVTEWVTSLLPIRLARPALYFAINGAIAVITTAVILGTLLLVAGGSAAEGWGSVLALVVGIVVVANVADYLLYRRTLRRLRRLQAGLEDGGAGE